MRQAHKHACKPPAQRTVRSVLRLVAQTHRETVALWRVDHEEAVRLREEAVRLRIRGRIIQRVEEDFARDMADQEERRRRRRERRRWARYWRQNGWCQWFERVGWYGWFEWYAHLIRLVSGRDHYRALFQ